MKAILRTSLLCCLATASLLAQGSLSVINGARFELRYPVSPGSYAQAYGVYPGVQTEFAQTVPLPPQLGGVQVLVAGTAAPLVAVTSEAVSFQVPRNTPIGRAEVSVRKDGTVLATGSADVVPVSPGVFFVLTDPLAQGGVLNDISLYAVKETPAQRGKAIQIFGTGQGPVDIDVPDGAAPPSGTLANARGATKVYISVDEAEVTFSGLSPQFPGLWQINATVPNKTYVSGQVPLVVTIDGVPSNQTSFWVAE